MLKGKKEKKNDCFKTISLNQIRKNYEDPWFHFVEIGGGGGGQFRNSLTRQRMGIWRGGFVSNFVLGRQ